MYDEGTNWTASHPHEEAALLDGEPHLLSQAVLHNVLVVGFPTQKSSEKDKEIKIKTNSRPDMVPGSVIKLKGGFLLYLRLAPPSGGPGAGQPVGNSLLTPSGKHSDATLEAYLQLYVCIPCSVLFHLHHSYNVLFIRLRLLLTVLHGFQHCVICTYTYIVLHLG